VKIVKFTIILKQQDADGLGGDLLEAMGMSRSEHATTIFTRMLPAHNVEKLGAGDSSWSQPEMHTQMYVEALADYGIRPMRVFQKTDSTAGLTPLHASAWSDAEPEEEAGDPDTAQAVGEEDSISPIEEALGQVESAVASLSGTAVTAYGRKKAHFKPSRHSREYLDQVATIASNNFGSWRNTDEAEDIVRRAIEHHANYLAESVRDSFEEDDVKYIVESIMYSDDPDPYGLNPTDPKVGKILLQTLKKVAGPGYKGFSGVREDDDSPSGWIVWLDGGGKFNVDTMWQPMTQALNRAGYRNALVEPYDNVTLHVDLG